MNIVKFQEQLKLLVPNFKVKFKDESLFMKILGILLFFNPKFMDSYITTIGKTIYFPNRNNFLDKNNYSKNIMHLTHEFIHIKDYNSYNILFYLGYLFPQILSLIFIGLLPISIWFLVPTILFLLPWPAPFRKYFELRGYFLSIFAYNFFLKDLGLDLQQRRVKLTNYVSYYNQQFKSSPYYWMWPWGVEKDLLKFKEQVLSEDHLEDPIYQKILSILESSR